ncbi:histidinol-phosphate transaminase [Croceitalea sp. MTPC9]|uniref:histidinol-phosphate transaminase n=1 Tax=unclassified Croceitalea TaxID=2632280 RepID=UPI002B3DB243|nr:histidinol-phosphate transaminase [Croceitalea sp. MTPC6]GMN15784.1 histidinol-phosphate transaminase [Croceitalea sp. MTPC9]
MGLNLEKITRENVKVLQPYSSARDEYFSTRENMIFLDANENPNENGINRYPDPHQRNLKAVLAEQKGVSENQILLGNGSDEVLDLLFRAFCEPHKDNIISLPPTYGMYKVLAGTNAIENRKVLLTNDFQPDVEKILSVIDENSKLLFLCSPNNPTGNLIKASKIIELLEKFNGLIVIDEAYIDFSQSESWIKQLESYPNLVVTQTLSKAYGMAAIRLGMCFASKDIIDVLKKIKPPYNINELTQQRALKGFLNQSKVLGNVADLVEDREILNKELQKISYIEKVFPSEANFLLVKVDNATLRYKQLLDKGIVVRNLSSQALCEETLRFTIGTGEENSKLLQTLKELE